MCVVRCQRGRGRGPRPRGLTRSTLQPFNPRQGSLLSLQRPPCRVGRSCTLSAKRAAPGAPCNCACNPVSTFTPTLHSRASSSTRSAIHTSSSNSRILYPRNCLMRMYWRSPRSSLHRPVYCDRSHALRIHPGNLSEWRSGLGFVSNSFRPRSRLACQPSPRLYLRVPRLSL